VAELLREAHVGLRMVVRCAWCHSIQVGEEWLDLGTISRSQEGIVRRLRDQASHGICPTCFDGQMRFDDESRTAARRSEAPIAPWFAAAP
jgi:hypothetical protein